MDYMRKAELYLWSYSDMKRSIDHANYMINKLQWKSKPYNIKATRNEITGIKAGSISTTEEDFHQLMVWQSIRDLNLQEVQHIEDILDALGKDEMDVRYKNVLEMWYIKKMSKVDIAVELGYESRKSAYEIRKKALKKFAVALFGICALKS